MGEKIAANADSARMSYEIGTICTNAPIPLSVEDCRFHPEALPGARTKLMELEMRGIAARVAGDAKPDTSPAVEIAKANRVAIESIERLTEVLGKTSGIKQLPSRQDKPFSSLWMLHNTSKSYRVRIFLVRPSTRRRCFAPCSPSLKTPIARCSRLTQSVCGTSSTASAFRFERMCSTQ
jgi:hypothetical protein